MDCKLCYRYLKCWDCAKWLGCKEKPLGTCFECETKDCPDYVKAAEECEACELPEVE